MALSDFSPGTSKGFFNSEFLIFRQGFAPRLKSRSRSNAIPYREAKISRWAFKPDNVLSVKQTAFDLTGPSNFKVNGLNTFGFTAPYHPTEDAFKHGSDLSPSKSSIEKRRLLAIRVLMPLFWRTRCVRRKEQSELRRASLRAVSVVVLATVSAYQSLGVDVK